MMTPFQKLYLLVVVLLLCFLCSNPKEDSVSQTILIDNSPHGFTTIGLTNVGKDPSGNQYQGHLKILLLLSEGIALSQKEDGTLNLKGKGTLMGLLLYDNDDNGLNSGDYFIDLRPPHNIGEASIGFYTLAFDENKVDGPYFNYPGVALLAGKINVKNTPKHTQLTLDLVDENGKKISGTIQQPLTPFSYTLPF